MAKNEVVMPQMGESITTGTITKWHKAPGDTIEIDEILLEISTDKVESEIPSPFAGKVVEVLYPEGETIDVGKPIAYIDDDANAEVSASAPAAAAAPTADGGVAVEAKAPAPVSNGNNGAGATTQAKGFYTPLVRAMAKEAGIPLTELDSITGSGLVEE
jgi:pyruvate dehydrogenase E2 component (dihydrolipoamide acetyltransferase)